MRFIKTAFQVHESDPNWLEEITQGIEAEVARVYTNEERGDRPRLFPEGRLANFSKCFNDSGLIMRGVLFDLNTISIWYHAGFPYHANVAFSFHLQHQANATALPDGCPFKQTAVETSSHDMVLRWGWGQGTRSLDRWPTHASTCKALFFLNEGASDAHVDTRNKDDGDTNARRAGLSFSSHGVGASAGTLSFAQFAKGDYTSKAKVGQELKHGDVWTQPPRLRNTNPHALHHFRLLSQMNGAKTSCFMCEGKDVEEFTPVVMNGVVVIYRAIEASGWEPPSPDHAAPRGWWGEGGGGTSSRRIDHRFEDSDAYPEGIPVAYTPPSEDDVGPYVKCMCDTLCNRLKNCPNTFELTRAEALEWDSEDLAQHLGFNSVRDLHTQIARKGRVVETKSHKKVGDELKTHKREPGAKSASWAEKTAA